MNGNIKKVATEILLFAEIQNCKYCIKQNVKQSVSRNIITKLYETAINFSHKSYALQLQQEKNMLNLKYTFSFIAFGDKKINIFLNCI